MDNVLKISEAASLALHAIVYLADNGGHKFSNKDIAAAIHASEAHLSKVLQRLAKAGLVSSNRGPKGGFVLARRPDEITLLQVYEAIEGPMASSPCLLESPVCAGDKCLMGDVIGRLNLEVRTYLERTRLSDLSDVFLKAEKGEESCAGAET
ncbi:MAG TPA: Rrf2 family transcriptional regulator [bacterium]|nr:Rrf2 family transcriptional regulator [bacterium]